jgi:hypothetical protein
MASRLRVGQPCVVWGRSDLHIACEGAAAGWGPGAGQARLRLTVTARDATRRVPSEIELYRASKLHAPWLQPRSGLPRGECERPDLAELSGDSKHAAKKTASADRCAGLLLEPISLQQHQTCH